MNPSDIPTKERITTTLETLNRRLTEKGVTGELCIFGGTTMILFQESPAAFRVRNLFVSANARSRA